MATGLMATDLSLANRYAHSLALSLMVPVTVFCSEVGYSVVTSTSSRAIPPASSPSSIPMRREPLPGLAPACRIFGYASKCDFSRNVNNFLM